MKLGHVPNESMIFGGPDHLVGLRQFRFEGRDRCQFGERVVTVRILGNDKMETDSYELIRE
ncbi:MAG TPA: hypothetical protein VMR25_25080 [Planctomycetaceae bacterium]|nr:hypothetical protein [Planctomycetaceae bacterium]